MIVHMIGNAHLDPVWLWRWQQGVDEAIATFGSALDRCDEYPDFIFTRGEAWLYRQIELLNPAMFERVKQHVAGGQWHITGGQWIQPDCNLPTGEGFRRQILHGRRYFKEKFGVTPDVGYNVDSFGHAATLPDILAREHYLGYVFHRPSQQQTPVPGATFRWRGPGGGEVLGFRIPAAYTTRADDLYGQVMLSIEAADEAIGHVMCFYGVGNHGGGPTKGNIEYILNNRHAFQGAELQFSTPQRFFQLVNPRREKLPIVDFELQRTFPGCYVVMQDIKRPQRYGEHLLMQTEAAIQQWGDPADHAGQTQKLDSAWEDLLFTQFHDILAGTSINAAWESVRAMQGRARINAEEIMLEVTRRWARRHLPPVNQQQIALMNPGTLPFDDFIEHEPFVDFVHKWGNRWLSTADGKPIPYQHVRAQNLAMPTHNIVFPAHVGAGAAGVILLRDDAPPAELPKVDGNLSATPTRIANDHVAIELNDRGIAQIRGGGHDLLNTGITLHLREDNADTWGFSITQFDGPVTDTLNGCTWTVEETGPLRARVFTDVYLGRSSLRWTLTLHHDRPRIDLRVDVTFAERFRILQMPIDLRAAPARWRCGQPGGAVTRAAAPVEWPLHGWAHTLGGPGLAVVTQHVNSASLDGTRWTWSLVRGSLMANGSGPTKHAVGPDVFADQGTHRFDFQLTPITTDTPMDARFDADATRLAQPPVVFDRYEGMNRPTWGAVPPRNLWTAGEHRAHQDGKLPLPEDSTIKSLEEH